MITHSSIPKDVCDSLEFVLKGRRAMRAWIAQLKELQLARAEQIEMANDVLNGLIDSVELENGISLGELLDAVELAAISRN